jgi:hypothetical protein
MLELDDLLSRAYLKPLTLTFRSTVHADSAFSAIMSPQYRFER